MKHEYPYIDKMRIVAAILVICIHISPLAQINLTADFVLTRIIARIAVPFFFITTAYFLFQDGYPQLYKIKKTLFQLIKWYFIAIIIYLPVMFYNHYFNDGQLALKIIQDLLIDGTFYHLWYFPAMMTGIIIVLLLKKCFNTKTAFMITIILYMIGLSGDSYYGLMINIPLMKNVLQCLFHFMDYTRNGFFFAPLFIMIGVIIGENKTKLTFQANILMFLICFLIMGLEAYVLHYFDFCKHDSMYVLLPFVSYFFFRILISFQGQRSQYFKNLSLYMYVLHPLMIIVVRMIGKISNVELLINGNFVQFICVTILTLCISIGIEGVVNNG